MKAPGPGVHALVVTYRRPVELARTLAALEQQTRPPDSVTVIDNAADPDIEALVGRTRANYMPAAENLGPAGALHLGLDSLRHLSDDDWILFVDDDDPPLSDDAIEHLVATGAALRERYADLGGVGMAGARFTKRTAQLRRVPDGELHGAVEVDYIGGNQFPIYRARALRSASSTWADLFFGFEELELGLRLRRSGFRLLADGDRWSASRAAHGRLNIGPRDAARVRARSTWRRYYSTRNLIWISRHHLGFVPALAATARYGVAPMFSDLVRTRSLARTGASLRGIRDGWRDRLGRRMEPT